MAEILFSSALADVEYDEFSEELTITFQDGSTYTYVGVPYEVYGSLLSAGSTGEYFNKHIRNEYSVR
jgi:hypothetical protein